MPQTKRQVFVEALDEAITQLEAEERELLGRAPMVKGPMQEAIRTLKAYRDDCEGVPRLALIGVTGVGKSTFINHLFGVDVATVHPTRSTTRSLESFGFPPPGGDMFEVCDTRGLGEIGRAAEVKAQLIDELLEKRPHLLIHVVDAGRRDAIDAELGFLQDLLTACRARFHRVPRVLFVLNRCDVVSPSGFEHLPPPPWREELQGEAAVISTKRRNLRGRVEWFGNQLAQAGFSGDEVVLPCALEWSASSQRAWNRDEMVTCLHALATPSLLLGFGDTAFLDARLEMLAEQIVRRFALAATTVGVASLPVSDILVLVPLQVAMVRVISAFGTRGTLSPAALLQAIGLAGQGGKWVAQALIGMIPGAGQVLKAAVAGGLTYGLGQVAIEHYLHGRLPQLQSLNLLELGRQFVALLERDRA